MTAADRFASSLVAPHPDRATYDLAAFAEMAQADRRAAREVLEARAIAGDVRAIDTLAEVGDAESAAALGPLVGARGVGAAAARARLLLLDDAATSRDAAAALADERSAEAIAIAIARTRHPAALPIAVGALDHPSEVVRGHLFDAIVRRLGVEQLVRGRCSPLRIARGMLAVDLPHVRAVAARALADIAARVGGGEPPSAIDLDADPPLDGDADTFGRSFAPGFALDVEAARRLVGWQRSWALAFLAAALARRDARAPAALVALGGPQVAAWIDDAIAAGAGDAAFLAAARAAREACGG